MKNVERYNQLVCILQHKYGNNLDMGTMRTQVRPGYDGQPCFEGYVTLWGKPRPLFVWPQNDNEKGTSWWANIRVNGKEARLFSVGHWNHKEESMNA